MAEILARKRQVTMTALRSHQRAFGGPSDFYLKAYLKLAKLIAPATLRGNYWKFEDLSLFSSAYFLKPPHPAHQKFAEDIRARARELLLGQLRAGEVLDGGLVEFDELLAYYIVGCEEVAAALEKKREARKPAPAKPAATAAA